MRNGVLCGHRRKPAGAGTEYNKICNYILDTGKPRGCPAGAKCKRWTAEKCKPIL